MKGRMSIPVCTPHGNVAPCTDCLSYAIFTSRSTEAMDKRRVYKGKFGAKR